MSQAAKTEFLWTGDEKETSPRMVLYPPTGTKAGQPGKDAPAVIIFPGGGYAGQAAHEGEPIGRLFAQNGFYAFVLFYRVSPNRFPAPYSDAVRGVRLVRSRAKEYGIDPERIAVMGFSAGGHLASLVATRPDFYLDPKDDLATKVSARVNGAILCYPVISFVNFPHLGSCHNLLGSDVSFAKRCEFSTELWVDEKTPPTFLFHTAEDPGVPVENAYLFASACYKKNVKVELHVFPDGRHGVGLAEDHPRLKVWPELLTRWAGEWAEK